MRIGLRYSGREYSTVAPCYGPQHAKTLHDYKMESGHLLLLVQLRETTYYHRPDIWDTDSVEELPQDYWILH